MVALKMERKVQMQKPLWKINSQNLTELREGYVKIILRFWLWENIEWYILQPEWENQQEE